LQSDGFADTINASNGGMIMWYSKGLGATTQSAAQSYSYFSGYDMTPGWYVGGPPGFAFPYFPFTAVIDLNTGIVVGKDVSTSNYLTESEIISLVQTANGE
jgi:hypothetical protein